MSKKPKSNLGINLTAYRVYEDGAVAHEKDFFMLDMVVTPRVDYRTECVSEEVIQFIQQQATSGDLKSKG